MRTDKQELIGMSTGNTTMIYGTAAMLSMLLMIGYLLIEKKEKGTQTQFLHNV